MISIPFSLLGVTDWVVSLEEPAFIIMIATFGTLLSLFIIIPIFSLLGLKQFVSYIAFALLCSIFISMMLLIPAFLLFNIENALKLFLIWLVVIISCITFFLSNQRYVDMVLETYKTKAEEKTTASKTKRKKRHKK
ncbi:hypothetical protein [Providencia rettgeri]|uniref:hypothetical protein n=1 Tax=Providencia rettgeri TaxID=587 RepID=UPI0034E09861